MFDIRPKISKRTPPQNESLYEIKEFIERYYRGFKQKFFKDECPIDQVYEEE